MRSTVGIAANATLTDVNTLAADALDWAAAESGSPAVAAGGVSVAATGLFPLFSEMSTVTTANFALIDGIVIPIAILVLGLRVKSYRHMIVALVTLICAQMLAFAILVPIAGVVAINSFAPLVMQSLAIAINFDYTLFSVTRFREERLIRGRPLEDAVFAMLASSGHVVVLSGSTLFLTFVLLFFFPQNFLQSVGYACGAAVLTTMIAQLTIVPALFLGFRCFSYFDGCPSRTSCCCRVPAEDPALPAHRRALAAAARGKPAAIGAASASFRSVNSKVAAMPAQARRAVVAPAATTAAAASRGACNGGFSCGRGRPCCVRSFWFTIPWVLTAPIPAWLTVVAAAGITVPMALSFLAMIPSSSNQLIYLQGSASLNALNQLQLDFPLGALDPYSVLLTTGVAGGVLTPAYFAAENALIQRILASQGSGVGGTGVLNLASVTGLSFFNSQNVSWATAMAYANSSSPLAASPAGAAYRAAVLPTVNADASAALVALVTLTDPDSQAIIPFVAAVRAILRQVPPPASLPRLAAFLVGGFTSTIDVQDALYAVVPIEVGVVVAIVLLIIGVSFGSVAVALRLVVTVFLSLCWTFGTMVLVYQPGPAQTAFAAISSQLSASIGVYWIIPVMAFSILCGLALDYDIFLLTRVREFRQLGWSDRAAMCLAVEKTGGVITVAGVIMCVSFIGLLIPRTVVLNQYGFSLFWGVFIDTFIMRPVVVPVFFTLVGGSAGANWWPGRMPPVLLTPEAEESALLALLDEPPAPAAPPIETQRAFGTKSIEHAIAASIARGGLVEDDQPYGLELPSRANSQAFSSSSMRPLPATPKSAAFQSAAAASSRKSFSTMRSSPALSR